MKQDKKPSSHQAHFPSKMNPESESKTQAKPLKPTKSGHNTGQNLSIHQVTSLHQPLWFWSKHSGWSSFKKGIFWGVLVSIISLVSAVGGATVTRIDSVEQTISAIIKYQAPEPPDPYASLLANPINLLLVETQNPQESILELANNFQGTSKIILLVRIQPGLKSAQIVNIPTNSQVELAEYGEITIQDAYRIGGNKLLTQAVQQLTSAAQIDYYIKANPHVFRQLSASGRITMQDCDARLHNCNDRKGQILRQQAFLETIRQRLNVPAYLASFKEVLAEFEPSLDTNLATGEIITIAEFFKELDPESLQINLVSNYVPGQTLARESSLPRNAKVKEKREKKQTKGSRQENPFQFQSIAVQNTTDNSELAIQVVAYLRHRNFRDVYLIRHAPLRLSKTKLIANPRQVSTARYLEKIMGFGDLEPVEDQDSGPLILQVGRDAKYLPTNYRSFRY